MCDTVRLDRLGPSPKGGGEVEGESPANRRERRETAPESTMTQQKSKDSLFTSTLGQLACTEKSLSNLKPKASKQGLDK